VPATTGAPHRNSTVLRAHVHMLLPRHGVWNQASRQK